MCNSKSRHRHHVSSRKHDSKRRHHHGCVFKILKCSPRQLCALCIILYNLAAGNYCEAKLASNATQASLILTNNETVTVTVDQLPQNTTAADNEIESHHQWKVQCNGSDCFMKISSSEQVLKKMAKVSSHLFDFYATENETTKYLTEAGLERLLENLRKKDSHEGHDHGHHHGHDHGHGHDHEGHDHDNHEADSEESMHHSESGGSDGNGDDEIDWDNLSFEELIFYAEMQEYPCYTSAKELIKAYFKPPSGNLQLTFQDFMTLLPQVVLDVIRPECKKNDKKLNEKNEEISTKIGGIENSTANVWLISFGSVFVISLVSLLGVLAIPLLRHSKLLNYTVAFLVSLAVGTLTGDALLHLLPQATGLHDHSSHGHGDGHGHGHGHDKEEKDHFGFMWKGLMACGGIYVFYLLEILMGFFRQRKQRRAGLKESHCVAGTPDSSNQNLKVNGGSLPVTSSGAPLLSCPQMKAVGTNGVGPEHGSFTPLVQNGIAACEHVGHDEKPENHDVTVHMNGVEIETGHHHHHSHEVPKTIGSLAWMVVVGDGLHNITDGLAIGAAFTSGIGVGLSTVLAIFFHEIPQELADFAVLLNAGMTVKQALFWNFLSACMCFIGLIIGLLVGEYTNGMILWILAFTAGGFLYIGLVDMLPAMIRQLSHKDFWSRFAIQNVGMITGFAVMFVIGLTEDMFYGFF